MAPREATMGLIRGLGLKDVVSGGLNHLEKPGLVYHKVGNRGESIGLSLKKAEASF